MEKPKILKKIKFTFFVIFVLFCLSILAAPNYTKAFGNFFSSKARVTWDDGVQNSMEKRAYIYLKNQESSLTSLKYLATGHPLLTDYGCRTNAGADYLIDPGLDKTFSKGWYKLIQDTDPQQLPMINLYWGAATVSWGSQQPYERNCEYEYVYMPGTALPTDNQVVLVEGDIYGRGNVVGEYAPNKHYIAVIGNALIESKNQISGFEPGEITQVGFYELHDQSTSNKNILTEFKNKLYGDKNVNIKGFIDEYYNVKYGRNVATGQSNEFPKSTTDESAGPLYKETDFAKNPDGDVYVMESDHGQPGDLTIDSPVTLPENARKVVYVKGNLNIKSDIKPPVSSNPNAAVLAFVVEGDITVDGDVKDVEYIHAGLISLSGTIKFNHVDNNCGINPCRRLDVNGLVIGDFVEFNRYSDKITFDTGQIQAGVAIKYNPNIAKLPAFDQLLSAPAIDEASP